MGLLGDLFFAALKVADDVFNDGEVTKILNQEVKKKKASINKQRQTINRNINMYRNNLEGKSDEELINIYKNQENRIEKRYAAAELLKERGYGKR